MAETKVNRDDLIYILRCSVNDRAPDNERLKNADGKKLLDACVEHKLSALADIAVSRSVLGEDIRAAFRGERLNAMRVNILFLAETEKILGLLEQEGIMHMPLKGHGIMKLYPEGLLRQMGDVDILIGSGSAQRVRELMEQNGYSTESFGLSHDDIYFKPPFYKFEMHRQLFTEREQLWHDYYGSIEKRLLTVEGKEYRRRFSDEDEYIYMILHSIKHLRVAGCGIRCLTDIYYYLRAKRLDLSYIKTELEALGAAEEEELLRELALRLFSSEGGENTGDLEPVQSELLDALISGGVYGTQDNFYRRRLEKISCGRNDAGSKLRYILKRIFCIPEIYRFRCPRLYRHTVTRPLIFFVRVYNGLTVKRKNILHEFSLVAHAEGKEKRTDKT